MFFYYISEQEEVVRPVTGWGLDLEKQVGERVRRPVCLYS
jgi:hypothetical protein